MSPDDHEMRDACKVMFANINEKLDDIKEILQGNPHGLVYKTERLGMVAKITTVILMLVIGSAATLFVRILTK